MLLGFCSNHYRGDLVVNPVRPIYSCDGIDIYHGDSMEVLDFININFPYGDNPVDLLLTDPPYGIDYSSLRGKESIKNDALVETEKLASKFLRQVRWNLKPGASYYIFTGTFGPGARLWEALMERDQLKRNVTTRFRPIQALVWNKQHFGTGHYFRYQWERILFGCYGKKPKTWNGGSDCPDVLGYPRLSGGSMVHPTEKPIELIKDLIRFSTNEGDLVLEPFGGSGVVAIACRQLKRRCVSIELDEKHIETQIKRLESHKEKQVALF